MNAKIFNARKKLKSSSDELIFNKNIMLVLLTVYDKNPSYSRFNAELVVKLTGVYQSDDNLIMFFETIDFLVEEGYLRCKSPYVIQNDGPGKQTVQSNQPVYITEYGIKKLETVIYLANTTKMKRCIDWFKENLPSLITKIAINVAASNL